MSIAHETEPPLHIQHPEDVLALIPHVTGHRPREESVLFAPDAVRGALCAVVDTPPPRTDTRGDSPEDPHPELHGAAAEIGSVLRDVARASEVVVVVYRDAPRESLSARDLAVARTWHELVGAAGLHVVAVLVVSPDRWWDTCEPEHARPLSDVEHSVLSARLVAEGSAVEPPEPREDPRWAEALADRAHALVRAWEAGVPTAGGPSTAEGPSAVATSPLAGGPPCLGTGDRAVDEDERDRIVAAGGRDHDTWEKTFGAWDRSLANVAERRDDWVTAVLDVPDSELLPVLAGLRDRAIRTALLYRWLCGDPARARDAHAGLRHALEVLASPHAHEEEAPPHQVEEALRCLAAVAGEWQGPPHWESVDSAHRVLRVLDALTSQPCWTGEGSGHGLARREREEIATTVVALLAQLEVFRGRSHTAARLLSRRCAVPRSGTGPVPGSGSSACTADGTTGSTRAAGRAASTGAAADEVWHRLQEQSVPWWCTDPATSWPGRHWWSRQSPR